LLAFRNKLFEGKDYEFVVYWNNRNIRRKMPGDLIIAFKKFVDELPKKDRDKVLLLMHTSPVDQAGTDLPALIDSMVPGYPIIIDNKKWPAGELNLLYNIADITVNIASNEGFGLSSAESLMAGRMILNNVTGGLQDQCRFSDENGDWFLPTPEEPSNHNKKYLEHADFALTVFPKTRSLVGSVPTPYILDDRCDWEDVTDRLREAYDMGKTERLRRGMLGREWVTGDESMMSSKKMGERFMINVDGLLGFWKPKQRFKLYKESDITINKPVDVLYSFKKEES